MAIKFKEFMKDIKGGLNLKGLVRDVGGEIKSKSNLRKINKKALKRTMKEYPSYTVVGETTHKKRKGEFKEMIDNGKMKDAVKKARGLSAKFKKDNK